jgi:hypothetical protein
VLLGLAAEARADGAFPDERQVFLPPDRPHELVLGTNFGLLRSDDDGAHWRFVCEAVATGTNLVRFYQLGADDTVYAAAASAVTTSADRGCTWAPSASFAPRSVLDVFADPLAASRLYALGGAFGAGERADVYRSDDHAQTFTRLTDADAGADYSGVEASGQHAGVVWAVGDAPGADGGAVLFVSRSADQGATWTRFDHPELAGLRLGLAQVDAQDDTVAYLRLSQADGLDALAIASAGGARVEVPLALGEPMSSFVKASDGALYVGSRLGHLWTRLAGAAAFTEADGPELRCLGERGGVLYACGDNFNDGFALGASTDHGQHFVPVLVLSQVDALESCAPVQSQCAVALSTLQRQVGYVAPDAGPGATAPSGCHCGAVDGVSLGALLGLGLGWRTGRRRQT